MKDGRETKRNFSFHDVTINFADALCLAMANLGRIHSETYASCGLREFLLSARCCKALSLAHEFRFGTPEGAWRF